jgi:competence protein ComEC
MPLPVAYFWNKAPFTRLLFALTAGIILQWQLQLSVSILVVSSAISFASLLIYFLITPKLKYRFSYFNGIAINLLIGLIGAILVWLHDIRHNQYWIGNDHRDSSFVIVTIEEPLVEKTNSFKALASINGVYAKNSFNRFDGELVLYFKKNISLKQLHYGSQIIFKKTLQEIKNSGNPGSFDYKQYSLFQGITHQVNLSPNDFEILPSENKNRFRQFIFNCRKWVIAALQKFIH